ncbi:MAG: GTPase domain-containing protein [Thermoanaerobaculia bacterium]|nr:GTPase domain-containing protein [Thermoanaerobaculia bacterium]
MAQLDVARGRLVIRIVYDGPAFAGKTSSVRSLGQTFGREVFSSEAPDGRTLHFDWMDYEGGRFESFSLACQVITVPGQPELASRRRALLDTADAVVFVVDSRQERLADGLQALSSLRAVLADRPAPRPGLLVQANWRDALGAVALDTLRAEMDLGEAVGVTESVATDGTGIRQTFVLAVRLALDRAAALIQAGTLAEGPPEIEGGPALLAALERLERDSELLHLPKTDAPPPVTVKLPEAPPEPAPHRPVLPTADLPIGRVWPPVAGRLILHEADAAAAVMQERPSGDWAAQNGRWFFSSAATTSYHQEEAARTALLEWARWHTTVAPHLSPHRCLAMVEPQPGAWRVWQVLRAEPSLAWDLERSLRNESVAAFVAALAEAFRLLTEWGPRIAAAHLPVTLDSVGVREHRLVYVGAVPSREYLRRIETQEPPVLNPNRLLATLPKRLQLAPAERRALLAALAEQPEWAEMIAALDPES